MRTTPRSTSSLAALLLLHLSSSVAQAQTGVLSGRVTDAETGAAVPSVQVQIVSGVAAGQGTLGNDAGIFRLELSPGTYAIVLQSIGYRTQRLDGAQVSAGETTDVEVVIESDVLALDAIVVSASRKEEKRTDAPATVTVVTETDVEESPSTTLVGHLHETPGTDIMTTGLQATNVVVRGFNNIFSGALHALTDNRIAGVPSLRVNLLHFVPSNDQDVSRMEVVLGPGSALYGPNSSNGVLHIITKSPFDEQGTTVALAGGERSVFKGMFRTSHLLSDNFGVKVSGQLLRGEEWHFTDPAEVAVLEAVRSHPDSINVRRSLQAQGVPDSEIPTAMGRMGRRDLGYDFERWAGEVRADWRLNEDATAVFQAGVTSADGIELTGIGAGITNDWQYRYYQTRLSWNRLFAQLYLNQNDAGETFLVRRGINLADNSTMLVGQLQHGASFGEMPDGSPRQDFTYGFDYFLTTPKTEGKINGQYEDVDEIEDVGGYLQSETALSDLFDLVLAARVDKSGVLEDAVFSPRAALVFKPVANQAFRVTYNRAFSTPTTLNMFLDINAGLAQGLEALNFYSRAQGPGLNGISFQNPDGVLRVRSPFTPSQLGGPSTLLPANNPGLRPLLWQSAIGVLVAQGALSQQQAQAILQNTNTQNLRLMGCDPLRCPASLDLLDNVPVRDAPRLTENITQTLELGYQGVLAGRFSVAADLWATRRDNTSPLVIATPLVLLNGEDVGAMLTPLAQAGALTPAQVGAIAQGVAGLPLAVVGSSDMVTNTADVLVTYRNIGEVDYWGWDLGLKALLDDRWTLSASSSWVSTDFFAMVSDVEHEDRDNIPFNAEIISLNAPNFKGSLAVSYRNERSGFNAEGRARYTSEFPVRSADFIGLGCVEGYETEGVIRDCVEDATLFDLLLGYRIPNTQAEVQLNVQNVFDADYVSFVGVPTIGRFALMQLRYSF